MPNLSSGADPNSAARFCSNCGCPVTVAEAKFCKQCGAAVGTTAWVKRHLTWNPYLALGLSLVPGLGHFYRRQWLKGIIWLVAVLLAYFSVPLGVALHLVCAANAAFSGAIEYSATIVNAKSANQEVLPRRD